MYKKEIGWKLISTSLAQHDLQHLFNTIISFLDLDDMEELCRGIETDNLHPFKSIILINHYFKTYLNRVDRSLYYSFYNQPQFKHLEQSQTLFLNPIQTHQLIKLGQQHRQIAKLISQLIPSALQKQEIIEEIERVITDPDLPLPKLKRENQGIFCKTVFQNFLISLRTSHHDSFQLLPSLQQLKQYYGAQQNNYIKNIFIPAKKSQLLNFKIHSLRFTPYQISSLNYQQFLCEGCSLHNIIVSLFALVDIWLSSVKLYIESLEDPFHRHIQFLTRFAIYRNMILSIEQNFGFAFQQYNQLFSDVYDNGKPSFTFWRPALTKWLMKMEQFHESCGHVYHYCFTKLRMKSLLEKLEEKEKDEPHLMSIRNRLLMREYQMEVNKTIKKHQISHSVEENFQSNPQLYEICAIEYIEYMVDLSVNEQTVHWCGHSKQFLSQPYLAFEVNLINRNRQFLNHVVQGEQANLHSIILTIFHLQIQLFKKLQIKPVSLYKLIDNYNSIIEQVPFEVLREEGPQLIRYDFFSNDDLLTYYNNKCGIRFTLNKEEQKFYNINSILSADELAKNSISTVAESFYQEKDEENIELEGIIGIIRNQSQMYDESQEGGYE